MTDSTPENPAAVQSQVRVPNWLTTILTSLIVGMIVGGVATYAKLGVLEERLANNADSIKELKEMVKDAGKDRWSRKDHDAYADQVERQLNSLKGQLQGVVTEQARRSTSVWRVDKLATEMRGIQDDIRALRTQLKEHQLQDAHSSARAKLNALDDRLKKIENKIKDITK